MGATLSKLSSVTSRNSLRSDFPNTVPSSMPSPTSSPPSSPIRSIPWRQSRSGRLSHEKPITRVIVVAAGGRAVTAAYQEEVLQLTGFHGIDHLAGDTQHGVASEAHGDGPLRLAR